MSTGEPAILEDTTTLDCQGHHVPVFSALPAPPGNYPAIIIVHEIFGLNDHIRDVARRFARQGIAAFAPCLFAHHRNLPENQDDLVLMREVWKSTPDQQLVDDLQKVFSFARTSGKVQSDAIGVIGYCMGGAMAFMFACRTPLLAFAINYYGRIYYPTIDENKPRHPFDYAGGLHCPLLGLFSGVDELIPLGDIEQLQKKLEDLGKTFTIKVYPEAKHAFFNDTRPNYDADAAADAWQLTMDFIRKHTQAAVSL